MPATQCCRPLREPAVLYTVSDAPAGLAQGARRLGRAPHGWGHVPLECVTAHDGEFAYERNRVGVEAWRSGGQQEAGLCLALESRRGQEGEKRC